MSNIVNNRDLLALDNAYERGRAAAMSENENESSNPYAYTLEKGLYWEWMRGFREHKYGT